MIISHKHKYIFIHIPKCGGSTITHGLMSKISNMEEDGWWKTIDHKEVEIFKNFISDVSGPQNLCQHDEYIKVEQYFESRNIDISKYFIFSFVRNPWSRVLSYYFYNKTLLTPHALLVKKLSFKDFAFHSKDAQFKYVSKSGKIMANYIGKTKNLQEDFDIICDKIGIPHQKLPQKNETKHKHYTEYYDDETREIVAENYAKDIEYFGYKFGE